MTKVAKAGNKVASKKNGKDLIPKKEQVKIHKDNATESAALKAAREKMANADKEEPKQLNFNSVAFEQGDKKDFIFHKFEEVQDQNGDWYEAAILEDESGSMVMNADIVLKNTLKPLENEAPFAIRVTCSGIVQPKSGNKPYKNLTVLRF